MHSSVSRSHQMFDNVRLSKSLTPNPSQRRVLEARAQVRCCRTRSAMSAGKVRSCSSESVATSITAQSASNLQHAHPSVFVCLRVSVGGWGRVFHCYIRTSHYSTTPPPPARQKMAEILFLQPCSFTEHSVIHSNASIRRLTPNQLNILGCGYLTWWGVDEYTHLWHQYLLRVSWWTYVMCSHMCSLLEGLDEHT